MASAILLGAVIGALGIGALSDRIGRKKVMLICGIIFLIATFSCVLSSNYETFAFSRVLLGLAVGGAATLSPMYLADLAPKKKRGIAGSLFQMMVIFGILLSYIVSAVFLDHNILKIDDWRWIVGFALLPTLLLLIGSIILPESPYYLAKKGKPEAVRLVLKNLRPHGYDIEEEFSQITSLNSSAAKSTIKDVFLIAKPALLIGLGLSLFQ